MRHCTSEARAISPRQPAADDIVVMKVGRYHHVNRVQKDGKPFAVLEVTNTRADALAFACYLATGRQRVFLQDHAASGHCVEIDSAKQRLCFTLALRRLQRRHTPPT
jgi:hypothetical protein